ncbi:hypothetical protein DMA11_03795 [Marinilabiliaceae bacterium JC017]|nr:hypothetical protein DMA11_03795 [Marinilabiliaceae bacterium JC017]
MIYLLVIGTVVSTTLSFWFYRRGLTLVAEQKATKELEKRLFPNGEKQRNDVLMTMKVITNNRFSVPLMLDYFFKIKGLQVINLNDPVNFWVKKYLLSPTKMRLNYFEQVKFYETFLNYPEVIGKVMSRNRTSRDINKPSKIYNKNSSLTKNFA